MGIIALEFEVLILEVEEVLHIRVQFHLRQVPGLTRQLEFRLFDVVQVEMGVTRGVDEVAGLKARHLCHHLEQQGVRGDVEGHTQEGVGRTLIKLQRQAVACHVELEDGVTRGQRHLVHLCHVPCRDDHTARIRIVLQLVQHVLYLVDRTTFVVATGVRKRDLTRRFRRPTRSRF